MAFIKDSWSIIKASDTTRLIFLLGTAEIWGDYFCPKRGTTAYNSVVNDTNIKSLNIKLTHGITLPDQFELLRDILITHPNLQRLSVVTPHQLEQLKDAHQFWSLLCEALKRNRTIKELLIHDLLIHGSYIDAKMSQVLAEAIRENNSFDSIRLCASSEAQQILLDSFQKNSRISKLEIFGHSLNGYSIKNLFEKNTTITTLRLGGCYLEKEGIVPLLTFLQTTTSLQTLEFPLHTSHYDRYINDEDSDTIFNETVVPRFIECTLKSQSSLQTLILPNLTADHLNMIMKALIDNNSLTNLQLGGVCGSGVGTKNWAFYGYMSQVEIDQNTIQIWNELLTKNNTLTEISLKGVIVQNEDMSRFDTFSVDWFKHNKTLTSLDLSANNMIDMLVGDMLSHNKTLKALSCCRRFISDQMWQSLLTNQTLTEIDISSPIKNNKHDTITLLEHNTTVRKLVSTVDDDEWTLLFQKLANNDSITSFTNNKDRNSSIQVSAKAILPLKSNWVLTHLDLKDCLNAFCQPIIDRNRQFKLALTLVMHNVARQKTTILPLEIWRLIFGYLTPDVSILM